MIRKYALFSQNTPKKHIILVALMVLSVITSMVLLLSEENLIFTLGLIIPIFPALLCSALLGAGNARYVNSLVFHPQNRWVTNAKSGATGNQNHNPVT